MTIRELNEEREQEDREWAKREEAKRQREECYGPDPEESEEEEEDEQWDIPDSAQFGVGA